ncbi:hypothetical protein M7I_1286 [Glarea lozoyensis 74030]|uniref:Uncharacterized protein n=1 Tax=Glarea lozoyensis (strain ATCC 74030 / MF5533) TaxID=1104152 RepID=H0EFL0_GLAL7|nr:hypothetical protein M7I_1286 [Glarea lozoyensis 74030]
MSQAVSSNVVTDRDQNNMDNSQMDADGGMSETAGEPTTRTPALDQTMSSTRVPVDGKTSTEVTITPGMKLEVKLEDLFADEESDEEFPSSHNQDIMASSPPEASLSPVGTL